MRIQPSFATAFVAGVFVSVCVDSLMCQVHADESALAFFETRIRPVLIEHCYECHSNDADEIGGSLFLDTADGMLQGGDSGPAIVPREMDASTLISAMRYETSEMPPSGKLPSHIIQDFEKWIRDGAIDPRNSNDLPARKLPSGIDLTLGRKFWAFRPLQQPPLRANVETSGSWIDDYLLDSMIEANVTPNPVANESIRLRRLAFDLTGLPPSPNLRARWRDNPTSHTWRQVVDQLLASPHFGEHWARHWLDVARYADSNGSDFNATYHDAWRYRDYVIRGVAAGKPIDVMIREQIAGDLLAARTNSGDTNPTQANQLVADQLIATTFLMLGTKMLSERDKAKLTMDVVDEQIDTVGRAFMGLTLGCARCHDHKFDPVPMEDYYALAGIFRSTRSLQGESQKYVSTWKPTPLPIDEKQRAEHDRYTNAVTELQQQIKSLDQHIQETLLSPQQYSGVVIDDEEAVQVGDWQHSTYIKRYIGKGYLHDENQNKGKMSLTFQTRLPTKSNPPKNTKSSLWELRLWYTPGGGRAKQIPVTARVGNEQREYSWDQETKSNAKRYTTIDQWEISNEVDVEVTIQNTGTVGYVTVDAVQWVPLTADGKALDANQTNHSVKLTQQRESLELTRKAVAKELAELKKQLPPPLPHAMAVADQPTNKIADCRVHIRGETNHFGDVIPRGFLRVCGNGDASIDNPDGSGRLELAAWLTDPDHPLTARVFVNRVWMWLMGEGIVRTVDNFGERGERPSHPELLDALAIDFVRNGWQLKRLIRQIVSTDAYQRSSLPTPDGQSIDPENRLLWRAHRKRLPAESIRDAMLAISGNLDTVPRPMPMSGFGVLVSQNDNSVRKKEAIGIDDAKRTIFLPIIRGEVPALLATLDAADPDLLVGKRPTTNVPAQAFTLIGSVEVQSWARATANQIANTSENEEAALNQMYEVIFDREPTAQDRQLWSQWVQSGYATKLPSDTERFAQWIAAMFASTEFRLLD